MDIYIKKTALFPTIQFSIRIVFVYSLLNVKKVLFQKVQFRISTQFTFISPIDRTLSCATTLNQSGPECDGNKEVLQRYSTLASEFLVSYQRHSLRSLTPLQRSNRCILQPQPTGPPNFVLPDSMRTSFTVGCMCLTQRLIPIHNKVASTLDI